MIKLNRAQLALFLPNEVSIKAFEQLFGEVGSNIPDQLQDVQITAEEALAGAIAALSALSDLANGLARALAVPTVEQQVIDIPYIAPIEFGAIEQPYTAPVEFGTMALQNANNVNITGGTISATSTSTGQEIITPKWSNTNLGTCLQMSTDNASALTLSFIAYGTAYAGSTTGTVGAGGFAISSRSNVAIDVATGKTLGFTRNAGAVADITFSSNGNLLIGTTTDNGTDKLQITGTASVTGALKSGAFTSTGLITSGSTTLHASSVSLTNGAAAATATLTNAPIAGNPTKWIQINDNGTIRNIPSW